MATVTISGGSGDAGALGDNRPWKLWAAAYQSDGDGGVITTRDDRESNLLRPVAGVLTFRAVAGKVCYLENPDGKRYPITIPETDADLWTVIEAAVAYPPDTAAAQLEAAVGQFVLDNADAIAFDDVQASVDGLSAEFMRGGDVVGSVELPSAAWNSLLGKPWVITAAELAAGLIAADIVNDGYPPGHVYRYVTNTTPGTTDVTAQWVKFLSLGGVVDLDARVTDVFRITAQLVIKGGTTLRMGTDCVILRDWSASSGNKYTNACFKNENAPTINALAVDPGPWVPSTTDDNIYIEGGRIRPVDSSKIGTAYYLMGTRNLVMRDPVVERTHQDWAFAIGGDNFSITGVRIEGNAALYEDGVHILMGSGVVVGDYVQAGDDCFAIGSNWNLPIDGVDIFMGRFRSEKAFAIKLIQNREGSTAAFATPTEVIRNVRYHSGVGTAGWTRNGAAWIFATTTGLVEDITIDGVTIDCGTETHDGVNAFGAYFQKVKRLKLRDFTVKNSRGHVVHVQNCDDAELNGVSAPNGQGDSTKYALEIDNSLNARVIGGDYTRDGAHVVRMTGTSSAAFQGPLIREVADSFSGISVRDNSVAKVQGATFRKKSGATSAIGILSVHATAVVDAGGCEWDVSRPYVHGAAADARLAGITRAVTIASGAVPTYGDERLNVLCEGGVSDFLSSISGGYKGQVVTLVNGEADPATNTITIQANTGANQFNIGANFLLNSAATLFSMMFNGTNWVPVHTLAALSVPQIDLGNADTSLTRGAAGRIFVEGVELVRTARIITVQTGTSYTLVSGDAGKLVTLNNASPIALTVPQNSSVPYPVGTFVDLAQLGAGQVTVGGAGVTINGTPGLKISAQYGGAKLEKIATDTWILTGNLAA